MIRRAMVRKLNQLSCQYDCHHFRWPDYLILQRQVEIDALRLALGLKPMWRAT